MDASKRKRLEAKGWAVGDAAELLGLTAAEAAFVDLKAKLAVAFAERRSARFTQAQAAALMGSSQSRVAKIEAGDPTVALDLLVRGLLALGVDTAELGRLIARPAASRRKAGARAAYAVRRSR